MAMKDFMQKMHGWVEKATTRREEGEKAAVPQSTGPVTGFQPPVRRPRAAAPTGDVHPAAAFNGAAPAGVNSDSMPQFVPPLQPVQPQGIPMQSMPPQPYGNQASSQPMPAAQSMGGTMRHQPLRAQQSGPYQPRHEAAPVQSSWQTGYTQQQMQPQQGFSSAASAFSAASAPAPQAAAPVQQPQQQSKVTFFPGTVEDDQNNHYAIVMRVAQVSSIASCYHLLEFMQNEEAIIVNLDQISDAMEANRCIDMLFGAAYAMKQNFERISTRSIYLIAPRRVHLLPSDSMMQLSQSDLERRWPGLSRMGASDNHRGGQADFAPAFGHRTASPRPGQYTDFGGFSGLGSR